MRHFCPHCHVGLRGSAVDYRITCRQCGRVWWVTADGRVIGRRMEIKQGGEPAIVRDSRRVGT